MDPPRSTSVNAVRLLPDLVTGPAARLGAAAQNALEVARFGGLETGEEATPYEIAAEGRVHRLRRYLPPAGGEDAGPRSCSCRR